MYAGPAKRLCVRPDDTSSSDNKQQQHQLITDSSITTTTHHRVTRSSSAAAAAVAAGNNSNITNNMSAIVANDEEHKSETTKISRQQHVTALEKGALSDLVAELTCPQTCDQTKIEHLLTIRNLITACNKKKEFVVDHSKFPSIVNLLDDDKTSHAVKMHLALLFCSLAKAGEHAVEIMSKSAVDDKILDLLLNSNNKDLTEACFRCIRSIMLIKQQSTKTWLLQNAKANNNQTEDKELITGEQVLKNLISIAQRSKSFVVQECLANIFAALCKRSKDQQLLYKASAVPSIIQMLESPSDRVVIASLYCLMQMCLKNHVVSLEVVKARCESGVLVLDFLTQMMSRDQWYEIQFFAACCFAHIYRALHTDYLKDDPRITSHVLPTLIGMVHKDRPPHLRTQAAECIAYLIERETRLQGVASICDHLIKSLADMLEYEQYPAIMENSNTSKNYYRNSRAYDQNFVRYPSPPATISKSMYVSAPSADQRSSHSLPQIGSHDLHQSIPECEMKRAAFLALASLASKLEPIRKKIFETCEVMHHLVKSLTDSDTDTLKSVLTCLLSLSRSVQQLRTSFAENSVYTALKGLLATKSNEVLRLVLAVLCNISLDFSPGKQHFLDGKTIDVLCNLTRLSDPVLRLHGMWVLMNMVYQLKDQNLKFQILRSLSVSHVLLLLDTKDDDELVLKTLGFLRNLLSQKSHIDAIMGSYGDPIMQALWRILEKPCDSKIKEQALCVLTNIADGRESKSFLMNNRNLLNYLAQTMCDEQAGDLRIVTICCVINLAHKEYDGTNPRLDIMRKYGIDEKLKSLLDTKDPELSDKVRTAYNQFLMIDDSPIN